jgi:hypothetical protein
MFIPDPELDFLPIPDPGFRAQKGTGSRIRIRNTGLIMQNFYKQKKIMHFSVTCGGFENERQ